MKIDPIIILRELDRRKRIAEERAAPRKAELIALKQKHRAAVDAYLAAPWWKQFFSNDPRRISQCVLLEHIAMLETLAPFDGAAYISKHKNLYSLCLYAYEMGQDIELPFEYSYLLP